MTNSNANNKTKTKLAYISLLVIGVLLISNFIPSIQSAYATGFNSKISDCATQLTPIEYAAIRSLDQNHARSLADTNNELKSMIKGYKSASQSIFTEWSWNPTNCSNLSLNNINVVYTLKDSNGKYLRHVIVTEDPKLTKVLAIEEQNANVTHSNPTTNWSGYELEPGYEVQEVTLPWTMPTVSSPSGVTCSTSQACSVSIWSGIENLFGPPSQQSSLDLVQAGTDQNVTCTGCSSNDYVWYEALNDKTVYCNGYSYHHGESVYSDVTNEDRTNQQNAGKYDFTIADNNQGVSCTGTIDYSSYMTSGSIGVFMLERPTYSTGMAYLGQFTNSTSLGTAWMYYNGASNKITTSGMSAYRQDSMSNPINSWTYTNADTSGISNGDFTEYYHNSNGE